MYLYNIRIFLSISFIITFSILTIYCSAPSQEGRYHRRIEDTKKEKFYADALIFYDIDSLKARLDLYIELPNENVLFKKNTNTDKYESKILLTINIKNLSNQNIITEKINDSLSYSDEEMLRESKKSRYLFYSLNLETGIYKIDITIKDNNTKDEFSKNTELTVKELKTNEITISDLMILSHYKLNEDGIKEITPIISNNIYGLKEFHIFFEIYNTSEREISKEYIYKLKDNKENVIIEKPLKYTLQPNKNQKFESIFVSKELKKYLPKEQDFDFYLFDNEDNIYFKLEITDKFSKEIFASKKLNFIPHRINFLKPKEPYMR